MQIKRFAFEELWDFMEGSPPADLAQRASNMQAVSASLIQTQPLDNDDAATQEESNTVSEEELKLAKQQAYDEGLAEGIRQATQQESAKADADRIATESQIKQLIASFEHARSEHKHLNYTIAQELKELILITSEHVSGSALHALPLDSLERTIEQCIPMFIEEPSVTITVHPSISERFGTALHMIITELGYRGEYKLQSDTALSATDMRIAWEDGDASRDTEALWDEVKKMVHAMPLQQHLEQPELFDVVPEEEQGTLETVQDIDEDEPEVAVETTADSLSSETSMPMMEPTESEIAEDTQRVMEEGDADSLITAKHNEDEASLPSDGKEE